MAVYCRVMQLKDRRGVRPRAVNQIRREKRWRIIEIKNSRKTTWRTPPPPAPGRSTVRSCLAEWLGRGHGGLTYRSLTQVLSGHGCFGEYLRIGKERTTRCWHCAACRNAQHTLEECSAWDRECGVLIAVSGEHLSLPALVNKMIGSEEV
ncbi:uncharacterized protein LOC105423781 [Pogonomyrmex barbatus]|uniref:Uncharacterized protein LOC105423781 n=1 Tax=Pogonomyrmex barbatus TaxID=144034 RepID=A0A6I9VY02_9HYME|nr:uncharacterized protein LOC105423781 [Pogonomyrmex barbatus]